MKCTRGIMKEWLEVYERMSEYAVSHILNIPIGYRIQTDHQIQAP